MIMRWTVVVKKQPSQDVFHGDEAEEELGLARLVSSYTLPHQNSRPGGRGRQTARSKSAEQTHKRHVIKPRDVPPGRACIRLNKISHGVYDVTTDITLWRALPKESRVLAHR